MSPSIHAHDKLSLLTAYNSTQHYDIICISETYLDSSIDENTFKLDGCSLIRADYPGNMKRGGICDLWDFPNVRYAGFQYETKLAILWLPIGNPIKIATNLMSS